MTDALRLGVDGRVLDERYHGIGRITCALLDRLTLSRRFEITLFLIPHQRPGRFDIEAISARPGVRIVEFDAALTSATQILRWPGALRRAGIDIAVFPYHLGASLFGGAATVRDRARLHPGGGPAVCPEHPDEGPLHPVDRCGGQADEG